MFLSQLKYNILYYDAWHIYLNNNSLFVVLKSCVSNG